jgi:hypothetical protein
VTTAVDTNVLLDVLTPNAPHGTESELALAQAVRMGALVISEPVYAELASRFASPADLDAFLDDTGIRLQASTTEALHLAGTAWLAYTRRRSSPVCPRCGSRQRLACSECGSPLQPRQHMVADFMIGGHALALGDRLLTRDRGYYATYFPDLELVS